MGEMKSALERALERAEQMGKLSPEEMRKQKETEYTPIGEAIAQRFLEHGYTSILVEQLDKLGCEGKAIATRSALSTLIAGIDIENKSLTERALEGINGLKGSELTSNLTEEIVGLFDQYARQKKLWYEDHSEELGESVKQRLSELGISGSAVGEINIANNDQWTKKSEEFRLEFSAKLSRLKESFAQAVSSE